MAVNHLVVGSNPTWGGRKKDLIFFSPLNEEKSPFKKKEKKHELIS